MKHSKYFLFCLILFLSINNFAQTEREKGIEFYRSGDFDNAITTLENVVKTDKKDRIAWTYLGMSFAKSKKSKEAKSAFEKADSIPLSQELLDGFVIKSKPRPNYTDEARQNRIQGTVTFAIEFGDDGKIKYVFVIQGLPYGLTENCIESIKKIKFETAKNNGTSITVVKIIKYTFTLY